MLNSAVAPPRPDSVIDIGSRELRAISQPPAPAQDSARRTGRCDSEPCPSCDLGIPPADIRMEDLAALCSLTCRREVAEAHEACLDCWEAGEDATCETCAADAAADWDYDQYGSCL